MNDERRLDGRNALVTGSSRNLGAAIAFELSSRGAAVTVTYHQSRQAAEDLLERLPDPSHGTHTVLAADLSSGSRISEFLDRFELAGRSADILINNNGPFSMEPLTTLSESEWDRIWDSNVKAAQMCAQRLAPGMRENGWGRIVNISAGSAYIRNHSIYTLAKSALITLTESLALELGPEITVNAVAPGQIAESADDIAEFDPDFVERAISHTPLGRLTTREEVAGIVADLCDDRYRSVTGATIPIDGGWRLNRF